MGIEFMTGATMFALFNLISFLIFGLIGWKIYCYSFALEEPNFKLLKRWIIIACAFIPFYVFFGVTTAAPKLTIDPVQNRELIEYQDNAGEVEIETPPPRTEKMDGFTPLKE